jgi:hypothetical protein
MCLELNDRTSAIDGGASGPGASCTKHDGSGSNVGISLSLDILLVFPDMMTDAGLSTMISLSPRVLDVTVHPRVRACPFLPEIGECKP